jgi:hypothetical protein
MSAAVIAQIAQDKPLANARRVSMASSSGFSAVSAHQRHLDEDQLRSPPLNTSCSTPAGRK